ncbi:hypothetical protein SAY86_007873 [Trapa natans]|uniref:Uncharacterized protein n=1 Tax=Trapa natans TaxID=22666 RepID=A0AAN7QXD7_TRANT|nr:hypothetical protein SAY86_007873 [Trapa natans]
MFPLMLLRHGDRLMMSTVVQPKMDCAAASVHMVIKPATARAAARTACVTLIRLLRLSGMFGGGIVCFSCKIGDGWGDWWVMEGSYF